MGYEQCLIWDSKIEFMKSVCSGLDSWNVIDGLIQIVNFMRAVFRFVLVSVICDSI